MNIYQRIKFVELKNEILAIEHLLEKYIIYFKYYAKLPSPNMELNSCTLPAMCESIGEFFFAKFVSISIWYKSQYNE